jgi:hypothetical protein
VAESEAGRLFVLVDVQSHVLTRGAYFVRVSRPSKPVPELVVEAAIVVR